MTILGGIGFTQPWLLLGLAALPILWFLLRAVPPAPIRRRFPGVAILLGLRDDEAETDKTPWWLLLLRMLAVAAAIIGFAGPVLNPQERIASDQPLLIVVDGSWADARDWQRRVERIALLLEGAGRDGRPVAVTTLTDLPVGDLPFAAADVWAARLVGVQPQPWQPSAEAVRDWAATLPESGFDTVWISDGLARDGREALLEALEARGRVTVVETPRPVLALRPANFEDGKIRINMVRVPATADETEVEVAARGLDPNGTERELARITAVFGAGEAEAHPELSLPPELRNRVSRFELPGQRSAGAVSLTDDALKRREVALIAGREGREGLELLSPLHYLRQALAPVADLIEVPLAEALPANPDVIVLADVARFNPSETDALMDWVDAGGLLLRFAGPRLAASDEARDGADPLLPVKLRAGGRSIGGAMSWGEPKRLAPFTEASPFYGLDLPGDVTVSAQVLAQPGPELASRTIAALADGTPLVTRQDIGQGQIVLMHVTANAEWSSLPLSGLFVQMLERLAVSTRPTRPSKEDLAGTTWVAETVLDAFGNEIDAGNMAGVPGEALAAGEAEAVMPPGLYLGGERRVALNAVGPDTRLAPVEWPARIEVVGLAVAQETGLKGLLLALALGLLLVDAVAALWLAGRLHGAVAGRAALLVLAAVAMPGEGRAQSDELALRATSEVVLAHVLTGDEAVDHIAEAGLRGLGETLYLRTSVEPGPPIGVDIERDELAFFPFLYWPVSTDQPLPSASAMARLNDYLRLGGMIMFDTRDANIASAAGTSPEARRLQQIATGLDIPPLEPIPQDHVLTRAFYLLQDFPGRYERGAVWVEAAPPDAERVEGMPFRNLNDGVTPVVIGGNDWAAAWALDARGGPLLPVGRGYAGERQREIANRFGVNLIMYVLTGNYKSDQVHVPALLERLGQ